MMSAVLLPLFFFLLWEKNPDTPQSILAAVVREYESHRSVSYVCEIRMKYFSTDDTSRRVVSCELLRDTADPTFGGKLLLRDSPWSIAFSPASQRFQPVTRLYDGETIYTLERNSRLITSFNVKENGEWPIEGNTSSEAIERYFLRPSRFGKLLDAKNVLSLERDSLIDGIPCWKIRVNKPDEDDFTNNEVELFIDKMRFVILRMVDRVTFQNEVQYRSRVFRNHLFDSVGSEHFVLKAPNDAVIRPYTPPKERDYKLLETGIEAPDFTGTLLSDDRETSLSSYQGNVVLVDFWYRSCYPCIKALPHLAELYRQYVDSGLVVLGVNSTDLDEKAKAKLPDVLKTNEVTYPIILVNREVDKSFRVKVYPTLYVLDHQRRVVFSQLGFSESMLDTLRQVIIAQIRN